MKNSVVIISLVGFIIFLIVIIPTMCKMISFFEETSDTQLFDNNTPLRAKSLKGIDIKKIKDTLIMFEGVKVLNFWASWCKPCLEEIPSLEQLQQKYNSIDVLLLSFDDTNNVRKAIQQHKINLPAYFVTDTSIFKIPKVLPRTVVLRNDTVIRDMYVSRNWVSDEMLLMFDTLLKK